MGFDLWGFDNGFSFGLPIRSSGYLIGFLTLCALVALALQARKDIPTLRRFGRRWSILFGAICIAAPLMSGLFNIRIPSVDSLVVPGLPSGPGGLVLVLLGALPWLLAAGMLGTWEAMVVGFICGITRGGLQTHSMLTPLHFALQAGLASWLLRRDYAEWLGKMVRNPLFTSLIAGAVFGLLRGVEHYVYSGEGPFDGLDYALALLGPTLLAAITEAAIAGLVALGIRWRWQERWTHPKKLRPGPYRRSLAARHVTVFLLMGLAASLIVLEGDWLLAKAAAEEMLASQMTQTAVQAGEGIPFFVQAGRSLIRSSADEVASFVEEDTISAQVLADSMHRVPFFSGLDFVTTGGEVVSSTAGIGASMVHDSLAVEDALSLALSGIPQENLLAPEGEGEPALMGFFSPVLSDADERTIGALVGWTALDSNPLLQPVIEQLSLVSPGEAFVVDARGVVIIHPDLSQILSWEDLAGGESGEVFQNAAPDGTLRSVFLYEVEGYPWRVVVTTPQRVVNSLAVRIAARLFLVLAVVGILLVLAIYFTSRRLTLPLRDMAIAAEAIAAGELAKPVGGSGDDEVGRLAASFERMRTSLKARLDEMGLLLDVNQQLATSFELKQALPPILRGVQELSNADLVRLLILPAADDVSGELESYQAGKDPGNWSSIDEQVISLCLQGGQFVLENPSRARAVLELDSLDVAMATILGMPIQSKDAFIGAMWMAHKKPHPYTDAELNLLEIIARQLEASATNLRLYQLAEQERMRLGAVLQATPDAVIVTDGLGNISLANPAAEVVLRGTAKDALGKPAAGWITSAEVAEFLLQSGTEVRTAEVQITGDKVMFASATDVHAGQGVPMGRVCVLWDITHYKKLDELKSEFVATVSHDLRTPLTMVGGYARMLGATGGMSEQQMELVRKIQDGVDRMTGMVDNLLDQRRIDAGFGLSMKKMRIEEIIKDVVEIYQPQAESKQIDLNIELEGDQGPIEADEMLLRQAIANLVDNAIRYSGRQGKVRHIFEKLQRGDPDEGEGPGLGLSIVKSIAERHGGTVEVESKLGEGSSFTLDIPIKPPSKQ
jgi:signal transduction histidine kinase/HAMP domain-containing protein